MLDGRRRCRMIARWLGRALAFAPLGMVAAQPVAASPAGLWLPVCSGGESHWRFLPTRPGAPDHPDRDNPPASLCAHMMPARDSTRDTKGVPNRPRRT